MNLVIHVKPHVTSLYTRTLGAIFYGTGLNNAVNLIQLGCVLHDRKILVGRSNVGAAKHVISRRGLLSDGVDGLRRSMGGKLSGTRLSPNAAQECLSHGDIREAP